MGRRRRRDEHRPHAGLCVLAEDAEALAVGQRRPLARPGRRRACRADAEARFSAERMVDDYLRLYERIVSSA